MKIKMKFRIFRKIIILKNLREKWIKIKFQIIFKNIFYLIDNQFHQQFHQEQLYNNLNFIKILKKNSNNKLTLYNWINWILIMISKYQIKKIAINMFHKLK